MTPVETISTSRDVRIGSNGRIQIMTATAGSGASVKWLTIDDFMRSLQGATTSSWQR